MVIPYYVDYYYDHHPLHIIIITIDTDCEFVLQS